MGDINWAEIPERYFFNSQLKIFQIATDFWESHDSFYDCYCDFNCNEANSLDSCGFQLNHTTSQWENSHNSAIS